MPLDPGRLTRAAIHSEAGDVEVRLTSAGNWQLAVRASGDPDWRLACSGGLDSGAATTALVPKPEPLRIGDLLVDTDARRAFVGDRELPLRALEFDLLATLAADPDRVFTKQQLMRGIWGCDATRSTRTLDTHASRLRVLLRRAGADGLIVCVHGVGDRLWNAPG
jgi:DNA-binding response OmpR family regulator